LWGRLTSAAPGLVRKSSPYFNTAHASRAFLAAIAPEILYALWLYATLEGIGSARTITRLTQAQDAYRWIRGGV